MVCSWRSRPVCPPQTSLWFICFYWWWWSGKECYKQQQMATYDRILFLKNDDKKVKGVQNSQSPEMLCFSTYILVFRAFFPVVSFKWSNPERGRTRGIEK